MKKNYHNKWHTRIHVLPIKIIFFMISTWLVLNDNGPPRLCRDWYIRIRCYQHWRYFRVDAFLLFCLGIGTLVAISAVGSLLALVVPPIVIGLLGIVPISIGVVRLLQLRKHQKEHTSNEIGHRWRHHLSLLAVAAVTVSNGGDNIGIYVPLFAKYNAVTEITILSTIFMMMTGVWCLTGYYLVNHRLFSAKFRKIGERTFPFVLMGLGIYIIIQSFTSWCV